MSVTRKLIVAPSPQATSVYTTNLSLGGNRVENKGWFSTDYLLLTIKCMTCCVKLQLSADVRINSQHEIYKILLNTYIHVDIYNKCFIIPDFYTTKNDSVSKNGGEGKW